MNKNPTYRIKNGWTEEQDNLLVFVVLEHLRQGKTREDAFKVVQERIDRTAKGAHARWRTLTPKHAVQIVAIIDEYMAKHGNIPKGLSKKYVEELNEFANRIRTKEICKK